MAEYTPSELSVKIADEWLDSHRKSDTWRIVDMLRDEVVRLAAAEHRATRAEAQIKAVERLTYASDDGTEYEHNGHGPAEGEPECPGCWALGIRRALDGDG